jgi:leader peptidase (prepilin peptidase) / N-methyltransferase
MNLAWAAGGAVAGIIAGAALRGTVFRLSVPHGDPDRTTCTRCATSVRPWLAVRCPRCKSSLGRPVILELATGTVLALLLGTFADQPVVIAFCFLGVLGVALAAIDVAVQRLPDRLTLSAIPVMIALLAVAAVVSRDPSQLVRAVCGGLTTTAVFLALALARPGQLGGGDVKLAALIGLALGWLGWPALLVGVALGFALSAIVGLALLTLRKITLRSHIAFGPFMLGGALLGTLAASGAGR